YGGVYRRLPAKDPARQVEKLSYISEFFFRDTRSLETEVDLRGACHIRYAYPVRKQESRAICLTLLGFWTATIEISGAARVKGAHTQCVRRGRQNLRVGLHLEAREWDVTRLVTACYPVSFAGVWASGYNRCAESHHIDPDLVSDPSEVKRIWTVFYAQSQGGYSCHSSLGADAYYQARLVRGWFLS